jgi:hypothetical protein
MSAEVSSALKAKTASLKSELAQLDKAQQHVLRELAAAQSAASTLSDEVLVTSHAQLQSRLADAFSALRSLGVVPSTDATLHVALGAGGVEKTIETLGAVVTEAAGSGVVSAASGPPSIMSGLGAKELIAALVRQGKSASVAVAVCVALRGLIATDPTAGAAILAGGGIPALISILQQHSDSPAAAEAASGAISDVSRANSLPPEALSRTVEPLIVAVEAHATAASVVLQACGALRCALPSEGHAALPAVHVCDAAIVSRAVVTFIGLLTTHSSNDAVLAGALHALGGILTHFADDAAPELLRCRGTEAALTVLATHGKDPDVVEAACAALGSMGLSRLSKPAFFSGGGLVALNRVIESHADSPGVVAAACYALSKIARGSADAQTAVGSAGSVSLVLALLSSHGADRIIVSAACCMLRDATDSHAGNRAILTSSAGVPRICAAIVAHMSDGRVLECAVGALRAVITGSIECVAMAVRAGAIPALVDCLEEHGDEPRLVEQVCERCAHASGSIAHFCWSIPPEAFLVLQACAAVAYVSADNHATVVRCGGVELVVKALRSHSRDAGVTAQAARAVSVVSCTEDHRTLIVEAGGLGVLVSALSTFRDNAVALEHVSTPPTPPRPITHSAADMSFLS